MEQSPRREPNIALDGEEARVLMSALMTSDTLAPMRITVSLFTQLNALSLNQPPQEVNN
jgi:hypothetical protein